MSAHWSCHQGHHWEAGDSQAGPPCPVCGAAGQPQGPGNGSLAQAHLPPAILAAMGDGLVVADREGRLLLFNPAAEQALGLGLSDAPLADWSRYYGLFHADTVTPYDAPDLPLARALRGEETDQAVVFVRNARVPEGRFLSVTGRPLRDGGGAVWGGVVVFRDVTASKRSEQRLLHTRSLLQALLDNVPDLIYFKDTAGRYTRINRALARLFGLARPEDAVGATAADYLHPDYAREVAEAEREVVRTGTPLINHEERQRFPDGRERWVSCTRMPLRDEHGLVVGTFGIVRDVSERRRNVEALRQSEARFRSLFNGSPDAIFVEAFDGTVLDVNPAACRLQEMAREELVGKNVLDLSPPHLRDEVARGFRQLVEGALDCLEAFSWTRDGRPVPVELRTSRIDYEGRPALLLHVRELTERKQAEEELRRSQERFALAVRGSRDGIWDWDVLRGEVYYSPRWKEMLGYRDDEISHSFHEWESRVHPDDLPGCLSVIAEYFRGDRDVYEMEHRLRHKDGSYRWILTRGVALRDERGRPYRMAGSHTDITARKKAEDDLRRAEAEVRNLLESTGEGIYGIDLQGRCTFINQAAARMLGYQPDEVLGRPMHDLIHHHRSDGSPYPVEDCPIYRCFQEGHGCRVETEVLWRRDGTPFPSIYSSHPIVEEGVITGAVVSFDDITARKRAEEELRRAKEAAEASERRTRLIVDTAHDAYLAMDADGVLIDWNLQAEVVFGWPRAEALGRLVAETIIPPRFREAHQRGLHQFLATGRGSMVNRRIEVPALHRDGHEFPVELTISPVFLGHGYVFSAFLHDITARKRAAEELRKAKEAAEEANQAKTQFLANVSHEIRTPLHGILGLTELVLDTSLQPVQRDYLGMVLSSGNALLGVINDLLDFTKIEGGWLELDPQPFALRDALGDTVKTLAPRAYGKGLELAYHVAADVPDRLIGDWPRLRQVIINLLGNAVKFTEQGEVTLEVRRQKAEGRRQPEPEAEAPADCLLPSAFCLLHFAVRDTGIGVPGDKQAAIFQPFVQADGSMTRRYGGTGLGLAIANRLVEMMGGRIELESAPGRGSCFRFAVALGVEGGASEPPPSLPSTAILVLEGNATQGRFLAETLAGWGALPTVVPDVATALEEAWRPGFAAAIADARLAEAIGGVGELRQTLAPMPVLLLLPPGGPVAPAGAGPDSLTLTKPVKPSDLLAALHRALHCGSDKEVPAPSSIRPPPSALRPPVVPACRPLRLLVAEDSPVNQQLLLGLLARQGHSVALAVNGREALVSLDREPFDAVLLDVQMPEMDGLEAARRIRAAEAGTGRHLPLIALTAHAMKGDRERCLDAGMDHYLSKPIAAAELYRLLAAVGSSHSPVGESVEDMPPVVLDLDAARDHVGGDAELLAQLAGICVAEIPAWLRQARDALAAADAPGLQRLAHTIKGAVSTFGAAEAIAAALRLESLGKAADLEAAPAALADLEHALERLGPTLRSLAPGAPCLKDEG